jgi:hypothetical protein
MDKWENDKDVGIKPAHGLAPPKLSAKEASFTDKGQYKPSKSIYQVKSESIPSPSQTSESRKENTKLNKIHSRIGLGVGLG